MENEMNTIGKRIKYIRQLKGMTQSDLGDLLGRVTSAVQAWEYDQAVPKVTELIKLAELGETSIDWICTGGRLNEKEPISPAALEIARMYDQCSYPHKEKLFALAAACYRDSVSRNLSKP